MTDFNQVGIKIKFIKSGNRRIIIEQRMETEEDDFGGEELDSGQQGRQIS